ncbi:MAG TPA: NUDIX hydrolase, partial [Candidatus Hydrogenedentes bacterium]|nr:NUDIX hydrolase [Candidatus Hydrogenedentota bacterium]
YVYDYPRPMVTVDTVVFSGPLDDLAVLLIRRARPPFQHCWALPGGYIDMDEPLEAAARRELLEETGLNVSKLAQLGAYGDPGRDPRGRTISVVYWTRLEQPVPVSGRDDADAADWFSVSALPDLAFDHGAIIQDTLKQLRSTRNDP